MALAIGGDVVPNAIAVGGVHSMLSNGQFALSFHPTELLFQTTAPLAQTINVIR